MTTKRILIVEDNAKNLKLLRDVLQHVGYQVFEANDAETGISMAKEDPPDFILMDIQLPGMNGIEALKLIKSNPALTSIPIAAVTASVMTHDEARMKNEGFDYFIPKPVEVRKLLDLVKQVLQ
jgi:two-component system, cell cycle response regulator DivK